MAEVPVGRNVDPRRLAAAWLRIRSHRRKPPHWLDDVVGGKDKGLIAVETN